ncbi:hypothetical protein E6C76_01515 [Pseudothauera nasutitermitis]|uniref:DUF4194 domain-containing protein n=1 Tax=Pseudothauera nasutitermitis TaxID=2565930 RepID=A0A4S4B7V7_9RHOO|nr:hypothetical protein [Pseudothauera nasutitermitis]THF67093.1 hypothetical protein E6C76_01515 [Pseudothauera nasutitermitis]
MNQDIQTLTARLLANRWLPRNDRLVRRALVDETFRVELDQRLAAVGLQLQDNPYAGFVATALAPEMLEPVFGAKREYAASNVGLTRDEIALLVVVWSLIILPKRERQVTRREVADDGQGDMFGTEKPVEHGDSVSAGISEASLIADFGPLLGGRSRVKNFMLGKLARLGFIERRNGIVAEGPLLDVALDYRILADRIIHGTLAEVIARAGHPMPQANAFENAEILADTGEDDAEDPA